MAEGREDEGGPWEVMVAVGEVGSMAIYVLTGKTTRP